MNETSTSARDPGGHLPITPEAGGFYLAACDAMLALAEGRAPEPDDLLHVSEAKGMFGRLFILGQRDRLDVSEALGNPSTEVAKASHKWLATLRASLKAGHDIQPLFAHEEAHSTLSALDLARENLLKRGFRAAPEPLRD